MLARPVLLLSLTILLVNLTTTGLCSSAGSNVIGDFYKQAGKTPAEQQSMTVYPREIEDVLYNPGMGFADFHFGFGHAITPEAYPKSTVAYFRWPWADLEPVEGEYNFDLVDHAIEQAKAKGETLAFRIMSEYKSGSPQWLLDKGVASIPVSGGTFPDCNSPIFVEYHERLLKAFGDRYAGSPDIDHIDIGSVGCWGEWNTACCEGREALCKQYFPTRDNQIIIIDSYFTHFVNTPLVMLHGGPLRYAVSRGAGWRGDCFGDYGYFRSDWNHMVHAYAPVLQDAFIHDAWKNGPVQFEVCGVMQDWYDKGFDIDLILKQGLDWHVSVLNAKSSPIPPAWRPRVDEFMKNMGYRIVLREMTHTFEARPGETLLFKSHWENVGVAPMYHRWPLAYRLRSGSGHIATQWTSKENLMRWLPGVTHEVEDVELVPEHIPGGTYSLDVAILDQHGNSPNVDLAIEGKRDDRWYEVSTVTVRGDD